VAHPPQAGSLCHTGLVAIAGLLAILAASVAFSEDWPPAPPLEVQPELDPGKLPASVTPESTSGPGAWVCEFRFRPGDGAMSVNLAGTFNGWNRAATPMNGPDAGGYWTASVELGSGKHLYKFVINSEQWRPDPENPDSEDDGHSGQNSVLRLGRIAQLQVSEERAGDGQIAGLALFHRPDEPRFFQPLAVDQALVRYRTLAHDVERVWVAPRSGALLEMHLIDEEPLTALYEAVLPVLKQRGVDPVVATAEYAFVLQDGALRVSDPNTFARSFTESDVFQTPEWARHAIWYQIFPERFRDGDPRNNPQPTRPWTSEWFKPSPWEEQNGESFYKNFVFHRNYGGDLAGIQEKLGYLRELGVNALYLNPVFKSQGNHKYHTTSYIHIDDQFGRLGDYDEIAPHEDLLDPETWQWTDSDRIFLSFLKEAHRQGFRVIIDGVFNHTGTKHPAFEDVQKNGQNSRFADWYEVTSWEPFQYKGWAGLPDLPEFKKSATGFASDEVKQHLFHITRRWMDPDGDGDPSDGIDGWRLDVPNEVPAPFWVEWRQVVKSINPNAYITGEIWDRADLWLDGRHFDAVMNYEFARAVVAWIIDQKQKIKPSAFDRRLQDLRLAYPRPALYVMQNLLDSHDTDRIASMAQNPDRAYDHANRVQDDSPKYDNSKPTPTAYAKARLAALIQMTYVGAPMVYYGDEAGMWGADDPTNRKPMLWEDLQPYGNPRENFVMTAHLEHYKRIIGLRREHEALRTGEYQTLVADDEHDAWAFLRWTSAEQVIVAVNSSEKTVDIAIQLPPWASNEWGGIFNAEGRVRAADGKLQLRVDGLNGLVLHAATPR